MLEWLRMAWCVLRWCTGITVWSQRFSIMAAWWIYLAGQGDWKRLWILFKQCLMEPNDVIWRSFLSSCRNHRDLNMGEKALQSSTDGRTWNSSSHVLLSNLYAGVGMWGEAWKVRKATREKDLRKFPGCSWIELYGDVHEFVVGDYLYPQTSGSVLYSFRGERYTFGVGMFGMDEIRGGSPYGAGVYAGGGSRQASETELALAEYQGEYMASVVKKLNHAKFVSI